jgi:hypothetical protein
MGLGEITAIWIEIDTWMIEKMVLEEGAGKRMGCATEEL